MGFLYLFTFNWHDASRGPSAIKRIKRFIRERKVVPLFLRRAVHVVRDGERSTSVPHTTSMHYITKRVIARERWTLRAWLTGQSSVNYVDTTSELRRSTTAVYRTDRQALSTARFCRTGHSDSWYLVQDLSYKQFLRCCVAVGKISTDTTHRAVPRR